MNRKHAMLVAGFLTSLLIVAVFALTNSTLSRTPSASAEMIDQPDLAASVASPSDNTQAGQQNVESRLAEREATLQERVAQGQAALDALDESARPRIEELQNELTSMEDQLGLKQQDIEALQADLVALQQAIENDDLAYQEQLAAIQARIASTDQQMLQQINDTVAQLQGAYAEIAARQTASQNNGGGQSQPAYRADNHDRDDHDDDRYESHEHDDNHEHHDREHNDD